MKVKINQINPTNGLIPDILKNQFHYRKYKEFIGKSEIVIADMKEATWWNRPLAENTNQLLKIESDGLYSFNLPIAWTYDKWKSNYNVILNENNTPVAIHLCFKTKLSDELKSDLRKLTGRSIYKALIAAGIPEDEIVFLNNDILVKGKKIAGGECISKDNIYEENIFLTLNYSIEKPIFDRLTIGKAKPKRAITGVFDEFETKLKKEDFLKLYKKVLEEEFNLILEKHKATNELINL